MEYSKFIAGFILASCLFLLISATSNNTNTADEIPRYHIAWLGGGGTQGVAYDAVTGECKQINWGEAKNGNIKLMLAQ